MNSLIAVLLLCSFNLYAAQKVYPVSKPKIKLSQKQLIVEGEVKLSFFNTSIKRDSLELVGVLAPSLGCHQTYLCFARNFSQLNGQLVGDIGIDLDMDGNLDRTVRQTVLAEMKGDEVELENVKLIYVYAKRTIIEDPGKETFFSLLVQIP